MIGLVEVASHFFIAGIPDNCFGLKTPTVSWNARPLVTWIWVIYMGQRNTCDGSENCFETHNSDIDLFNYVCICDYHSWSRGAIRFTHTCQGRYHHVSHRKLIRTPDEDAISVNS